ncbi:dual specificity protein phosphatase 1-like isoform X5 [Telopea speciosissima]|uniref:dual specificity protein phosphatase 1-like isoform X5 n=1 Tax=Telopea speciosissima TaxID=54955 RepID=UPI001CC688BC|nr:dual specificity protein phosphatase 1-like isoform X5 [Telopea speciosissima]
MCFNAFTCFTVRYASGIGEFKNLTVFLVILVTDREDTDIAQYFDECFDFIDEAKRLGGGVLVHCFVGRSRRSKRPQAAPNSGFMLQLQNFEKSLKEDGDAAANENEQEG